MARRRTQVPYDFPDRIIRDVLRQAANLRELIARLLPLLVGLLDFDQMHEVPRDFLLDDYRARESDLLVEVPFRDNLDTPPLLICLLIEHQSTVDDVMPLRLLLYAVLYWEKQWHDWSASHPRGQRLRLTPVVPVVFYTGSDPWNGNHSLADLFQDHETLRAYVPQWQTTLCDLNTFTAEELVHSPEAFWQALGVVRSERSPPAEYLRIIDEVSHQLARLAEQARPRWDQLLKLVLYWSIYRRAGSEHPQVLELVRAAQASTLFQQEVKNMIEQMGLTWEQEIIQKAAQAKDAEFTQYQRTLLIKQLEQRFKTTLSATLRQQIEGADLATLNAALERLWEIKSPEDLKF